MRLNSTQETPAIVVSCERSAGAVVVELVVVNDYSIARLHCRKLTR